MDLMYWIAASPIWLAVLVIVIVPTVITMCGPIVVRRLVGMEKIVGNNEVAGFKFATLGVIYADPFSSVIGIDIPGAGTVDATKSMVTGALVNASGALVDAQMRSLQTNRVYWRQQRAGQPDMQYWIGKTFSDPAIFDFYHHQMIGPNGYAWANWRAHNIAVEQRLFGGKGG